MVDQTQEGNAASAFEGSCDSQLTRPRWIEALRFVSSRLRDLVLCVCVLNRV